MSAKSSAQDRGVGVGHHVVLEHCSSQHVVDQPAQERDVAAGPDRHVQVGHRAGPGEPRVDVDDLGAARLGLHHPLEADRMALGHVRSLDQDAVGVLQVLLEGRGAATAERGPQTGNGGGVSYAGLVLDLDRAQGRVELLHEVVLLVVEGRSSEAGDPQRAVHPLAVPPPPARSRRVLITRSAIMSIAASSESSSHSVA